MLDNAGTSPQIEFYRQKSAAKPADKEPVVDIIHGPHKKNYSNRPKDVIVKSMKPDEHPSQIEIFQGRKSMEVRRNFDPISGRLIK